MRNNRTLCRFAGLVVGCWALLLPTFAQQRVAEPASGTNFRIAGTVASSLTGQPLAHTNVEIGVATSSDTLQSMLTGDDGRFEFDGLAPAKYWLRGARNGFRQQALDEHQGFFTAVVVGPGLPSDAVVFRLQPDASISGVITDDQNEAVRDAQVFLFRDGIEDGRRARVLERQLSSNDQGRYNFSHLASGKYYVVVSARPWYTQFVQQRRFRLRRECPGHPADSDPDADLNPALNMAYPLTYYSGVTDENSATPIIVKAGDHAGADLTLTPVHALTVRIHQADSNPDHMYGASVEQVVFDGRAISVPQENLQGRNGEIDISGLAPGEFTLHMQSFGNDSKEARSWTETISLTSDTDVNVPVANASAAISGLVTINGMRPGRRAYLQLQSRSGNALGAQVSPNGVFEIPASDVRPGTYQVTVGNLPGSIVAGISATGAKVVGQSIVVGGSTPVRLTVNMSQGLATVDGLALKNDAPVPSAMIVLVPQNPEKNSVLFRRDQSDSDGTFSLAQVLPGKYTVVAIENGWDLEWASPAVLQPYLAEGTILEISPGRKYRVKVNVK